MTTTAGRSRLEQAGAELLAEAGGRSHRADPVLPRTGGPAGNARLTAWTGLLLLVLFLAELVTLLDVRGLIDWHVAIGVLLVPPALLKTATTGWRILRYYTRGRPYVSAGPPLLALRVLGPFVVLTSLGLLGTGLALVALGEQRGHAQLLSVLGFGVDALTLHQGFFIVWAVATGLHVLARLVPAVQLAGGRRKEGAGPAGRVPGAPVRVAVLALTLAVAGVTTALVLPAASSWQHERFGDGFEHHHRPGFPPPP
jgi:hypothetical protein